MFGVPSLNAGTLFPNNQVVMNVPRYGRYKTVEVSSNKRYGNKWSAQVGGSYTWLTNFPNDLYPNNPNMPGVQDRTTWQFKIAATYDAPFGLHFAPLLRHQSGVNFARTLALRIESGRASTSTFSTLATATRRRRSRVQRA
jgi:hypothetical protein